MRTTRTLHLGIAMGVVPALVLLGCAGTRQPTGPAFGDAQPGQTTVAGVLRGGIIAIGGESTGWRLESGDREKPLDVDVSGVIEQAESLRGRLVLARGRMTSRVYTERGETPVLVVDQLFPARE